MPIFTAALIAALMQAVLHLFPWQMIFPHGLPRLLAYILGVLGFLLPVSGLFVFWQEWASLAALWAAVIASGLAVLKLYGLDWILNRIRLSFESEEREHAKEGADQ